MGIFRKRERRRAEISAKTAWAESAQEELHREASQLVNPYARRVAQAAAFGAPLVIGPLTFSNSPLTAGEEPGQEDRVQGALRRAQWAIGMVEVRMCVPFDQTADVLEACLSEVGHDRPLADEMRAFWREHLAHADLPATGAPLDELLELRWFRELAAWVPGQLLVKRPEKAPEVAVATTMVHLLEGCSVSLPIYAGAVD